MKIQINYADIEHSDALSAEINERTLQALKPFEQRVTRVEIHLRDDKQKRRGHDDMRCTVEVRLAGDQPFVVEANGADIYDVVKDALGKARRATEKRLARREEI